MEYVYDGREKRRLNYIEYTFYPELSVCDLNDVVAWLFQYQNRKWYAKTGAPVLTYKHSIDGIDYYAGSDGNEYKIWERFRNIGSYSDSRRKPRHFNTMLKMYKYAMTDNVEWLRDIRFKDIAAEYCISCQIMGRTCNQFNCKSQRYKRYNLDTIRQRPTAANTMYSERIKVGYTYLHLKVWVTIEPCNDGEFTRGYDISTDPSVLHCSGYENYILLSFNPNNKVRKHTIEQAWSDSLLDSSLSFVTDTYPIQKYKEKAVKSLKTLLLICNMLEWQLPYEIRSIIMQYFSST